MSIQLTAQQIEANVSALQSIQKCEFNIEGMIDNDLREHIKGNSSATAGLVSYWNAGEAGGVGAKVRQQFSRVSKRVFKELEINFNQEAGKYHGIKVEDGVLVLAPVRGRSEGLAALAKKFEADNSDENYAALIEAIAAIKAK